MATRRISIFGSLVPDTGGNVYFEPASIKQTNDRYAALVLIFKDAAAKMSAGFRFDVPQDYVSAPVFRAVWSTPTIVGNAVFDVDYTTVGGDDTTSLDPAADEQSVTVTDAAPTAANSRLTPSVAVTAVNFAVGETVVGNFSRDGLDVADTLAADLMLYDLLFEYSNV